MTKGWFEVDKEGLKQLQGEREKHRLVAELIQNAFDEKITVCKVSVSYIMRRAIVVVEDDSPEGFRFLKDAYTLFGYTYKREDPTKRGRFNVGEKQVISICKSAFIETTKGTVKFNEDGTRTDSPLKRESGTKVELSIPMTQKELEETIAFLKLVIPPKEVQYEINGEKIQTKTPFKTIDAKLETVVLDKESNLMRRTIRKTEIFLYKSEGQSQIYEMGMPVMEIDDAFSYDVQQKIPLTIDRSAVLPSYVRDVRAECLNEVIDDLKEDQVSATWVREATKDDRVNDEVLGKVADMRFGDKRCIPDYNDPKSVENAMANQYTFVARKDMDAEEWSRFKGIGAFKSSSSVFPTNFASYKLVPEEEWTEDQVAVVNYAKKIAKIGLGMELRVSLIKSPNAGTVADFGDGKLRFNVSKLSKSWWASRESESVLDLIIHELGHSGGLHHLDEGYHRNITKIGARVAMFYKGGGK